MLIEPLLKKIQQSDVNFISQDKNQYLLPLFNPKTHYLEIANSKYFKALTIMRHNIKLASDFYWSTLENAYNIDLFMFTSSVSSPMGPGSDSEAIDIQFGNLHTYLVDSSQFGFEPILMNGIDKVYCYLPSMRGENPDKRHLNQFFHCEAEIVGSLDILIPKVENYIKFLTKAMLAMENILLLISLNFVESYRILQSVSKLEKFPEIEFDKAIQLLKDKDLTHLINQTEHGRDLTSEGEVVLLDILNIRTPLWIKNYDRDRVAFYQKPHANNPNKVINADLIFPKILNNSFGGEIAGCGQRQDNAKEMLESINRQNLDPTPYSWYINLRNQKSYATTSGFGLGIERFIAWALCRDDIKEVILYPRLKNVISYP